MKKDILKGVIVKDKNSELPIGNITYIDGTLIKDFKTGEIDWNNIPTEESLIILFGVKNNEEVFAGIFPCSVEVDLENMDIAFCIDFNKSLGIPIIIEEGIYKGRREVRYIINGETDELISEFDTNLQKCSLKPLYNFQPFGIVFIFKAGRYEEPIPYVYSIDKLKSEDYELNLAIELPVEKEEPIRPIMGMGFGNPPF